MVYCLFLLDLTDDMKWIVWSNAEVDLISDITWNMTEVTKSSPHPRPPQPARANIGKHPFKI